MKAKIETGSKKEGLKCVGIDSGINALASTSSNNQYLLRFPVCCPTNSPIR